MCIRDRHRPTRLNGPTWAFLALGGGLALLTPLTIRTVDKLFFLPWVGRLAAPLGLANGLPTNEVAGVLTLIIPLAVALAGGALWTRQRRLLGVLLPLVALLLPALLLTQSRTGLTATAVGVLVALIVGARPRRQWLGVEPVSYTHLDVYKRQPTPSCSTCRRAKTRS